MYQLVLVLTDIDYKEDLIHALQSVGVSRASVIEAGSLDQSLESESSLFKGFLRTGSEKEGRQILVVCKVDSLEVPRDLVKNLEASGMNLENGEILRFYALPTALSFNGEFIEGPGKGEY